MRNFKTPAEGQHGDLPPAAPDDATRSRTTTSLATRIAGWTTNLLATAVILLVALLLGAKLIALWRPMPAPPSLADAATAGPLAFVDDPTAPVELQFGDSPLVMHRQIIPGDRKQAMQQLSEICEHQLAGAFPMADDVGEDERRLLLYLARQPPISRPSADASLYQLPRWFPMIVGTRKIAPPIPGAGRQLPARGQRAPARSQRVVVWGVAVPGHDGGWSPCSFRRQAETAATSQDAERAPGSSVPVPPQTQRLLAIRAIDGAAITAFRGSGQPAEWAEFYESRLPRDGWQNTSDWLRRDDHWYGRFEQHEGPGIRRLEVYFYRAAVSAAAGVSPRPATDLWRGMLTESAKGPVGTRK